MNNPEEKEKIYVKVNSDFDSTGYMQPRTITWDDGRTFRIEQIRGFRPVSGAGSRQDSGCYTVVINGVEKHLFFERTDPVFASRVGRWFVERNAARR